MHICIPLMARAAGYLQQGEKSLPKVILDYEIVFLIDPRIYFQ